MVRAVGPAAPPAAATTCAAESRGCRRRRRADGSGAECEGRSRPCCWHPVLVCSIGSRRRRRASVSARVSGSTNGRCGCGWAPSWHRVSSAQHRNEPLQTTRLLCRCDLRSLQAYFASDAPRQCCPGAVCPGNCSCVRRNVERSPSLPSPILGQSLFLSPARLKAQLSNCSLEPQIHAIDSAVPPTFQQQAAPLGPLPSSSHLHHALLTSPRTARYRRTHISIISTLSLLLSLLALCSFAATADTVDADPATLDNTTTGSLVVSGLPSLTWTDQTSPSGVVEDATTTAPDSADPGASPLITNTITTISTSVGPASTRGPKFSTLSTTSARVDWTAAAPPVSEDNTLSSSVWADPAPLDSSATFDSSGLPMLFSSTSLLSSQQTSPTSAQTANDPTTSASPTTLPPSSSPPSRIIIVALVPLTVLLLCLLIASFVVQRRKHSLAGAWQSQVRPVPIASSLPGRPSSGSEGSAGGNAVKSGMTFFQELVARRGRSADRGASIRDVENMKGESYTAMQMAVPKSSTDGRSLLVPSHHNTADASIARVDALQDMSQPSDQDVAGVTEFLCVNTDGNGGVTSTIGAASAVGSSLIAPTGPSQIRFPATAVVASSGVDAAAPLPRRFLPSLYSSRGSASMSSWRSRASEVTVSSSKDAGEMDDSSSEFSYDDTDTIAEPEDASSARQGSVENAVVGSAAAAAAAARASRVASRTPRVDVRVGRQPGSVQPPSGRTSITSPSVGSSLTPRSDAHPALPSPLPSSLPGNKGPVGFYSYMMSILGSEPPRTSSEWESMGASSQASSSTPLIAGAASRSDADVRRSTSTSVTFVLPSQTDPPPVLHEPQHKRKNQPQVQGELHSPTLEQAHTTATSSSPLPQVPFRQPPPIMDMPRGRKHARPPSTASSVSISLDEDQMKVYVQTLAQQQQQNPQQVPPRASPEPMVLRRAPSASSSTTGGSDEERTDREDDDEEDGGMYDEDLLDSEVYDAYDDGTATTTTTGSAAGGTGYGRSAHGNGGGGMVMRRPISSSSSSTTASIATLSLSRYVRRVEEPLASLLRTTSTISGGRSMRVMGEARNETMG
ncbi:hypothetical protein DFJ73DRAFT_864815 [Zopfochytrium polystomum]|nr:hypothetical protein DFJ73DRAFT_864815 [Zopfochytrium polystomum]